jgi:hypothetical protein
VRSPPATPSTLQTTEMSEAPVTVAAYCDDVPSVTLLAPLSASFTGGGGGGGAARATTRLRATEGSATLEAVIVTFEELGAVAGAVYNPRAEIDPMVRFPPTTPFTLHVTPVFELPVTVAAYCDEVPNVTVVAPLSVRVIVGGGGGGATTVTLRLRATEGSTTLVAVIVTFKDPDALAGAV